MLTRKPIRNFLFIASLLGTSVTMAFPEGSFICGSGDTTNEITITKTTLGSEVVPFLKVHIKRPELESKLAGAGLQIEITDKKSGEIERRLSLPGSNVDIVYTKDDEIGFTNFSPRCHRK